MPKVPKSPLPKDQISPTLRSLSLATQRKAAARLTSQHEVVLAEQNQLLADAIRQCSELGLSTTDIAEGTAKAHELFLARNEVLRDRLTQLREHLRKADELARAIRTTDRHLFLPSATPTALLHAYRRKAHIALKRNVQGVFALGGADGSRDT